MSGMCYAAGDGGERRELSEFGRLSRAFMEAVAEGRTADAEAALRAKQAYHQRHGTYGKVMHLYATPGTPRARTSTPTTPARAGSGGSLLADITAIRRQVAALSIEASAALAETRRRAAVADADCDGEDWEEYLDDLEDNECVSEEEARRERMRLIG
jgi:hypothetical protein